LALKDNINALKDELTTQEQLLENIIKSERFFKKHKKKILTILVILVVGIIYYVISGNIKERNLIISNEAYSSLQQNPQNSEALETLKSKNKPLYRLYVFQEAIKNENTEVLEKLIAENSSDFVGELSSFYVGKTDNVRILDSYIKVQKGYELMKEGKVQEAGLIFQTIPADSGLMNIINALEHYQPEAK
jgi:hypothetical protein